MITLIILTAVAILGIFIAFKFKGIVHRIISIGIAISLLFAWIGNDMVTLGLMTFILLSIVTFIYGLIVKEIDVLKKIGIVTMGFLLSIGLIFKLLHLPYADIMKLLMIIPIIVTLMVFNKNQPTKEISFMMFWLVYAVLEFLMFWG
jgi:hypothetical protein